MWHENEHLSGLLPFSHPLFPIREEANSRHVPTPDRPEPHWGGHRRDERQGGRAAAPVLGLGGGHDPSAAQTAGQCQRSGTNHCGLRNKKKSHGGGSVWNTPLCCCRSMPGPSLTPEPSLTTAVPRNFPTTRSNSLKRCLGTEDFIFAGVCYSMSNFRAFGSNPADYFICVFYNL